METQVGELSGGERRRVNLAAALVRDVDLLILDEPTNHLDIEGVQWLAQHILQRRSALVVVTHDRWFLDAVATRTWEVHDGTVDFYDGGYNDWPASPGLSAPDRPMPPSNVVKTSLAKNLPGCVEVPLPEPPSRATALKPPRL